MTKTSWQLVCDGLGPLFAGRTLVLLGGPGLLLIDSQHEQPRGWRLTPATSCWKIVLFATSLMVAQLDPSATENMAQTPWTQVCWSTPRATRIFFHVRRPKSHESTSSSSLKRSPSVRRRDGLCLRARDTFPHVEHRKPFAVLCGPHKCLLLQPSTWSDCHWLDVQNSREDVSKLSWFLVAEPDGHLDPTWCRRMIFPVGWDSCRRLPCPSPNSEQQKFPCRWVWNTEKIPSEKRWHHQWLPDRERNLTLPIDCIITAAVRTCQRWGLVWNGLVLFRAKHQARIADGGDSASRIRKREVTHQGSLGTARPYSGSRGPWNRGVAVAWAVATHCWSKHMCWGRTAPTCMNE